MEAHDLGAASDVAARLALPGYKGKPERAFLLHLETFDWNCPQHITPRFTTAQIESVVSPLRIRVATLEAEDRALRAQMACAVPVGDVVNEPVEYRPPVRKAPRPPNHPGLSDRGL
jgi:uncharacterized protein